MDLKRVIHNTFQVQSEALSGMIDHFSVAGKPFGNQERNSLKLFDLNQKTLVIKSFRVPNLFNQIAYKFFRKSKAQRSFEYANKLTKLGIGTPQPIAYYEFTTLFLFKKSYYISAHLECDLTYRELTTNLNYPDHEAVLRAFTRFTFDLHEKGINFLDHSPGNTLIKKVGEEYQFYLVDLNRMAFKPMDFESRIKNFSRLTIHESMVKIMSDEYAKASEEDFTKVFKLMWKFTQEFQERYHRKQRLKKKLKFWKK
jgi:hypothetical protein